MDAKKKKKKIKKLRKAHIWPSIVFLLFCGVWDFFAAMLVMGAMVNYFAADRITTSYDHLVSISKMFEEDSSVESTNQILEYLQTGTDYADAVYILDENGQPIAGFGGQTYTEALGNMAINLDSQCKFRLDTEAKYNILDEKGDIDEGRIFKALIRGTNAKDTFTVNLSRSAAFSFNDKTVFYEDPIWFEKDLPDSRLLVMKTNICVYVGDLILVMFMTGISFVVTMIPCCFLFANVIINVANQRRMTKLIYTDPATGGNGWLYFEHYADKRLYGARKSGKFFAVVDISLMKYRSYCICHGVEKGEELLGNIDKLLKAFRTSKEIEAHNQKADFALLLTCNDREECVNRVENLLKDLPDALGHGGLIFHAGMYFVATGKSENSIKDLKKRDIDVAEYYNRAGSARSTLADDNHTAVAVFDDKLLEEQLWEHRVEEKMQHALDNEEFQVYIQPKYNPVTERLAGAEALVRWINEEDGFISPGRFIPIFEANGFIVKLDDYMISHVAKLQADWLKEGKDIVPISVNVSRAHFANPDLAKHICELVDAYELPHKYLEIELTESAFFDDKDALISTVMELKKKGFDVSMDDFGSGYSSLNSLKDLPLDVLKLDADFFRGEMDEERGEIVVSQAINLAKQLNMRIVAEGVEKKNQVDFLAAQDCDMIQGFYYAKPMPVKEYEERL